MEATDWTSAELVMASLLGAFAIGTFVSNGPARFIAGMFARLSHLGAKGGGATKPRGSREA